MFNALKDGIQSNASSNGKKNPYIIPLGLLCIFAVALTLIRLSKPEASRRPPPPAAEIQVSVQTLLPQNYSVIISSYGLVEPLTQSTLVARVNGVVEFVDESFREGGHFREGQVLVRLDKSDYRIELKVAQGQVAEAESRYANELALAAEARASWRSAGRTEAPPPLAVREPQVAAAKAALQSAQAGAQRAQLNLARTEIIAPYDGQVLEQLVDLGQLVNAASPLARIFSSAAAEVRLPIKSRDIPLLSLPSSDSSSSKRNGLPNKTWPEVVFRSSLGEQSTWQGTVVRVASGINTDSRQLHLIARIPTPFEAKDDGKKPLKVNEYLKAEIKGRTLEDVIVIPNSAIYQNSYVYIFDDQQVRRREITMGWGNSGVSIIESGVSTGEQLVLTPLGQVPSGTPASIAGSGADGTAKKKKPREKPRKDTINTNSAASP